MDATALYAAANTVTFPNRVQVSFDFGIQQVVLVHQVVVVVLNIPPAVRYNDNVFAFAQTGDFLWQIDTIGKGLFHGMPDCPFVGANLTAENDERVLLYNWCSTTLLVQATTGEVLERYQSK